MPKRRGHKRKSVGRQQPHQKSISSIVPFVPRPIARGIDSRASVLVKESKLPHVLCVDTGRSSETAKAHRG
eukprot:TRINITY_DN17002_c0_g1_i1.p1 TRINITY_DN17002_c0_g1~~TRINITY_DN17002_c0_g1_i1.p1  ORF type:complete len:71 (+),score=9.66 TRINITY_DN17002_c0_g1_i1:65-277(+)